MTAAFATIPGDEPLRVVLVGAGAMGRLWARTIAKQPAVRLVAWVDVVPGLAAEAVAELRLASVAVAHTLAMALDTVEADAVIDVAVPEAHRDITVAALERGLAVLGEKPLAPTMAQAREMITAAERSGRLFMVSQSRRYDVNLVRYRAALDTLRPVALLTSQFFLAPRFGGFRDEMADPLLLDMAIHTFDAARYLGAADPVSVWCDSFNPAWSWYRGDACAVTAFELSDGGRYVYTGSWCADGTPTSWNADWRGIGRAGSAHWDGELAVTAEGGAISAPDPGGDPPQSIGGALADFVTALRTGRTPMGECHDNVLSLAMVHAALASARDGVRVRIDEILSAA